MFTAFAVRRQDVAAARVGFTTPRALGKAVIRNRVRRRLREVVRLRQQDLTRGWDVVFNPRRVLLDAPLAGIEAEAAKFLAFLQKQVS